ncbi:MAG: hypothetical protein Athens101410_730 [Parcubacteria group bacterium Athens1014_10]|nr:MAG: hypothetical protein Athens101410_730 [Parcubacteria group bacterium Athens1014_10]TSD05203.1 MAG: hypothetical protein Athens071412_401 [Parcubacteria group bacterium Athens0714_12]
MHKNPNELGRFERESYEESLTKEPSKCNNYFQSFCLMDIESARAWYCNNGNPCIEKMKYKKWEGCDCFKGNQNKNSG